MGKLPIYAISPLLALSLTAFLAPAYGQMMTCPMDDPLHHLPMCITHHYDMGDIDNQGVYQSLLSKGENAVSLADKGNTGAAIALLNALINELQAQRGVHVTEMAADMLIHHAVMAIEQIS